MVRGEAKGGAGGSTGTVSYAASPGRVAEIAGQIRAGTLTPVEVVRRCLERIGETEPRIEAWVSVDADGALAAAEAMTAEAREGRFRGKLHGVPVGIKDICDVAGWPTRCNSRTRDGAPPVSADAEIVAALRAAGAIILGKTQTTEYAFYDPSPARNPHNPARTPGGSSSGSAAAIASGMVPAAVGTQTVASVNRPAAYCGIAAFKPSTRAFSTYGIAPLSPVYDTPGLFALTVADAAMLFEAVCPGHLGEAPAGGEPRVIVLDDPFLAEAEPEILAARDAVCERLRAAGHPVVERPSPVSMEELQSLQAHTVAYEMARVHARLLEVPAELVGTHLRKAVVEGASIAPEVYFEERRRIDALRADFFANVGPNDLFLWPATPATAPEGLAWTGDRRFIAPWTALGGPVVSMPAGMGAGGLPIGMLLAGRPSSDRAAARHATTLADGA